MANQMIALQARGPQLPDAGALTARYANVMANMSAAKQKQDEIARAAEFRRRAESGVDVLTPEGFNQIAGLDPEGAAALRKSALDKQKADAEFKLGYLSTVNKELQRANTPEQALAIGQSLKQAYPMFADNIDQTLSKMPTDPAQFPAYRRQINLSALDASQRIEYELAKVTTESIIGEKGTVGVLTKGGEQAPMLEIPKTLKPDPMARGTVDVEPAETVEGGVGGPTLPMSTAPTMPSVAPSRMSTDMAGLLTNARNDAEYQQALGIIQRMNPEAAQALRQIMPTFQPELMNTVRAEAQAAFGGGTAQPSMTDFPLVSGPRGGPREGYVESSTPFRARVPAPPSQPQPRETAEEAAAKRRAVLNVEREFELTAPPKKLTPVQEAKLRDNIAKDYKSTRSTIEMMGGVSRAINDVRNLSDDQLEAVTGWSGLVPSVRASSRTADVKIKNLKGKVTEMGKAAASLSGAIGQMAVQEWRIVSDMIADLDVTGMEPNDLKDQLDIIEAQATRAANVTRDAYENQYAEEFARYPGRFQISDTGGAKRAPKPGSQYPVMTPEQVRRAPKGTKYRTTDGRLGVKP